MDKIDDVTKDLIWNTIRSRGELLKKFLDPRRDIEAECGLPAITTEFSREDYKYLYNRDCIAARVVEVLPEESWVVSPTVYEDEDSEVITEFEEAWDNLGKDLKGGTRYREEEGSAVWEYLLRADILSGIGHFGCILLGLDDGKDLNQPVDGVSDNGVFSRGKGDLRKLLYLRVFDESLCTVSVYENDTKNPRYGMPKMYQLTFNDFQLEGGRTGQGVTIATMDVHWSRVVHIADNLGSSEVFGKARICPVLDNVLGLRKVTCGSPEMYWRGAFPGLSIETHPQLGGDVSIDATGMREQMLNYMDGLQRYLALTGMTAKSLAPQLVDPTPWIMSQIELICIKLGIPKRIFMGSERGQLASGQDDQTWNDRLRRRQTGYLTPRVICPFVDRLIDLRILPEPLKGYTVEWPDLNAISEDEKATIGEKRTRSLAQYVAGGVQALMTPVDFLTRIIGFNEQEAMEIVENALEQEEDDFLTTPEMEQAEADRIAGENDTTPGGNGDDFNDGGTSEDTTEDEEVEAGATA